MLEAVKIDGKPVILETNKDGDIIIKRDLLEKLLEDAYEAGKKNGTTITYPNITYPTWPNSSGTNPNDRWWEPKWTCTSQEIPCKTTLQSTNKKSKVEYRNNIEEMH